MRSLTRIVAPLLAILVWSGCAENQPADVGAVIEANCTRQLACDDYETFEECSQFATSIVAAFQQVYGDLCLDAWLAVLDCETQRPCDEQAGCEAEESTLDSLCGFDERTPSM